MRTPVNIYTAPLYRTIAVKIPIFQISLFSLLGHSEKGKLGQNHIKSLYPNPVMESKKDASSHYEMKAIKFLQSEAVTY